MSEKVKMTRGRMAMGVVAVVGLLACVALFVVAGGWFVPEQKMYMEGPYRIIEAGQPERHVEVLGVGGDSLDTADQFVLISWDCYAFDSTQPGHVMIDDMRIGLDAIAARPVSILQKDGRLEPAGLSKAALVKLLKAYDHQEGMNPLVCGTANDLFHALDRLEVDSTMR